jgi:hypothetical protein
VTEASSISSNIQLYDSEIIAMDPIVRWMGDQRQRRVDLESFRKEIIERFGMINLRVNVKVWETNVPDVYAFDVDIAGRVKESAFDFDKMIWEVTHNILEEPGVETGFIKGPGAAEAKRLAQKKAHKH